MDPTKEDEDDDLVLEIEELDEKEARRLEMSVSISGSTNLSEVGAAVAEHGDVIDDMFDSIMLSEEKPLPNAPPPATIPPPGKKAAMVFKPPGKKIDEEGVIDLSGEEDDIIFLEEDSLLESDKSIDEDEDDEEAFYRQFEKHD